MLSTMSYKGGEGEGEGEEKKEITVDMDYVNRMKKNTLENQAKITKESTMRPKKGKSAASGYFMTYSRFDKDSNKMEFTQKPPKARTGTFQRKDSDKGGSWFMQNFEFIARDLAEGETVKKIDETHYECLAEVKYKNDAEKQKVQAYLREHPIEGELFMGEEGDFLDKVWYKVPINTTYKGTLLTFSEGPIAQLESVDPVTKQRKIRKPQPIDLHEVTSSVYLQVYDRTYGQGDNKQTVTNFKAEFSFTCSKITHANLNSGVLPISDLFHEIYDKDETPCPDIKDVLDPKSKVQIPDNAYIWAPSSREYMAGDGRLIRIMMPIMNADAFVRSSNDVEVPDEAKANFVFTDIYGFQKKTFHLSISANKKCCQETGLDTEDIEVWKNIHLSNTLSSHFVCTFNSKGSMSKPVNQPMLVENRDNNAQQDITHGTYDLYVSQWVVDWPATLRSEGIPVTMKCIIDLFTRINDDDSNKNKMFDVLYSKKYFEFKEKGDEEQMREHTNYQLKSALSYPNPIVTDGLLSQVIPFGSATRPTFSCSDASPIINNPNAEVYVLTSMPKSQRKPVASPEEGDAVFLDQLDNYQVKYQVFIIQNLEKGEKTK